MTMEDDKFQDMQGESKKETQETQKASRVLEGRACVWVWVQTQAKADVPVQRQEESPFTYKRVRFFVVLLRPSNDWMSLTHTREGDLLHLVAESDVNLIQAHPHGNS